MAHDELVLCDEGDLQFSHDTDDDDLVPDTVRLDAAPSSMELGPPANSDGVLAYAHSRPASNQASMLLPPPPTRRRNVVIPRTIPIAVIRHYAQLPWLWLEPSQSPHSAPRPAREEGAADSSAERTSSLTTKKRATRKRAEPRRTVA